MFVTAIEKVNPFTRPIHFITRYYGGGEIEPGSATMFFVNEEGCAVTCKHVAELLINGQAIYGHFLKFRAELRRFEKDKNYALHLKRLEDQHGMTKETVIRLLPNFLNSIRRELTMEITPHPTQDLAIIKFSSFDNTFYQSYATFLRNGNEVKQGRSLCRLGYPFPEFTNYRYNKDIDDIEWTTEGRQASPSFPIDGIVTRQIGDPVTNRIEGIELSTPGLRGQSGGPLFDRHGIVYGMQSATRHLHLGFDQINKEVSIGGKKQRISNYPFLNVGQCVHVNIIKDFLREKGVKFYEADPPAEAS